jgi:hypothetical protein
MNALTVETWVKPDLLPGGGTGIVAKWSSWAADTGGSYILWQGSSGTVGWGIITETSSAFFYDTPVLQPGVWYHLVGTYDGAQIRLYLNGSQVGTPTSVTGRIASTSDACYIGRYTTPYFNGTMDEVRVSNVARTPAWIQTEYSNQQSPSAFYSIGAEETQIRAVLSVDPSLTQKTPSDVGTTFDINVTVSNVTDLFGFEFNLTWDKDLIRLVNVDYESTLDSIWGLGNWVMVRNDTAPGWYRLVAVSTLSGFTTTSSRPITRLTFKVEAFYNWMAETNLHFSVVKLSNSQANPILTDVADGTYMIDAQKPLVEIISGNILLRKYAERFNATVNIDHALGVKDFQFEIYYNASMLTYVSGSDIWGDLGIGLLDVNETEGSITGSVSSLTSLTGRHWLLNLTFEDALRRVWRDEAAIPGWMNNQSGRMLFRWVNLSYLNHADLSYQEGGSDQIVVTELHYVFSPIQGDTDNDGHVDVFDLRIIGYYYDIKSSDPGWTEASKYDLNGDNIIDVYDLVLAEYNFGYVYDC